MKLTNTKITVATGMAVIAAFTLAGVKLAYARQTAEETTASLSPIKMDDIMVVEPDGSVQLKGTIVETNRSSQVVRSDRIGDLDEGLKVTDASGKPLTVKKLPEGGCRVEFGKKVAPGQTVSYSVEINLPNVFKADAAGNYVCDTQQQQGNDQDLHLVEIWRLPPGATLVTNNPAMTLSTNEEQRLELRLDTIVPPGGKTSLHLEYRLDSKEK